MNAGQWYFYGQKEGFVLVPRNVQSTQVAVTPKKVDIPLLSYLRGATGIRYE
jgi:hypothetical protein